MKSNDRYCSLTLDEMSIDSKIEYDSSSGGVMGMVTLPGHSGPATHGLVFMLSGLCLRWKQTVAFYYTGNFWNRKHLIPPNPLPLVAHLSVLLQLMLLFNVALSLSLALSCFSVCSILHWITRSMVFS